MGSSDSLKQTKAILSVFNARVFEATNNIYTIIQSVEGKLTYTNEPTSAPIARITMTDSLAWIEYRTIHSLCIAPRDMRPSSEGYQTMRLASGHK